MDLEPTTTQTEETQAVDVEQIKTLATNIQSSDEQILTDSIAQLRQMLCVQPQTKLEPIIDQLIAHDVLDRLSKIIRTVTSFTLKYNTLWCFINVCCGNSEQVDKALEAGLLPLIFDILTEATNGNEDLIDLALEGIWLIGNISGDSIQHRDTLLDQDAADKIVAFINKYPAHAKLLDNGSWALQNLVSKKPAPFWNQVEKAFKFFLQVLETEAVKDVKFNALWGICYLSGSYTVDIVNSGSLPIMVKYLDNEDKQLVFPALQILGNVLSSQRDNFTDEVLKQPAFLASLVNLCDSSNEKIRVYATWAISNIAAGTPEQIAQIIDKPEYLQKLGEKLDESDEKVRYHASCALSNLVFKATPNQIEELVNKRDYLETLLKIMKEEDLTLYAVNLITAVGKIVETGPNLIQQLRDKGVLTRFDEIVAGLSYELKCLAHELVRTRLQAAGNAARPGTTATTAAATTAAATTAPASTSVAKSPKKSQPKPEKPEKPKAERPKETKKIRKAAKTTPKKKAPIRRTKTMQATIDEAKNLVKGIRKGGRTRQSSKPATAKKATPTKSAKKEDDKTKKNTPEKSKAGKKIMKRTRSMKQTLAEAKQHLKHIEARKKAAKKN